MLYILLYLKWITNKAYYCIAQEILLNIMYQPKWEKNLKKNRYIYIYINESLCYTPETNKTL